MSINSITETPMLTPEQAKEQGRKLAQLNLDAAVAELNEKKKSIEQAQRDKAAAQLIIDAAKPTIMLAEAAVMAAKANLLAFGGAAKSTGGSPVTFEQVLAVLRESPKQMTVVEIAAALAAHGVNANTDNLKAYLARWSQTGSILKGDKANRLEPARYYAPSTNGVPTPPFLGGAAPAPNPAFLGGAPAVEGTHIPDEFPASLVLREAGITTMEAIPRDEESLRKIKGVGSATARAILTALEA